MLPVILLENWQPHTHVQIPKGLNKTAQLEIILKCSIYVLYSNCAWLRIISQGGLLHTKQSYISSGAQIKF